MHHRHLYHSVGWMIFRQFKAAALILLAVFLLFNPVTVGVGLALLDHFSGEDYGARFFGHHPAQIEQPATQPAAEQKPAAQPDKADKRGNRGNRLVWQDPNRRQIWVHRHTGQPGGMEEDFYERVDGVCAGDKSKMPPAFYQGNCYRAAPKPEQPENWHNHSIIVAPFKWAI